MPIIKHTRIPKHKKADCDGYISFFGGILEQQGGGNLRLIVSVASDLEVPTDRHFTSTRCALIQSFRFPVASTSLENISQAEAAVIGPAYNMSFLIVAAESPG